MPEQELSALGPSKAYIGLETIQLENSHLGVTFTSDEVTAICPVSGQPDFYTVRIHVVGWFKSLESKSLKLYLGTFRDQGVFCEDLAGRICRDVVKAFGFDTLKSPHHAPRSGPYVTVTVIQKSRGGITLEATSAW